MHRALCAAGQVHRWAEDLSVTLNIILEARGPIKNLIAYTGNLQLRMFASICKLKHLEPHRKTDCCLFVACHAQVAPIPAKKAQPFE
jgi:hypothetical protein